MSNLDERDLLVRELRERSGDVDGHPVGFADVRRSAKRMQRRRHVVAGSVAAVLAGIALPTGVAVNSALDSPDRPDRQPTFATSPTQGTPSEAPTPAGPVPLTLDGLERGRIAEVDYLLGAELRRGDGTRVDLVREYQEIAPFDGGWVALWDDEGSYTRDLLDADGTVTSSLPSVDGLAVSLDGDRVAFSQVENGEQQLFDSQGSDPRTVSDPAGRLVFPVGYAGDGVLVYRTEGDPGQVFVYDERSEVYEVPADPRLIGARGTSEAAGLVAGQLSYNDDDGTSCWAVVSYRTGDQMFGKTCDWALESFSPDGRYVIGVPSDSEGLGPRGFAILSAQTGEVLTEFEQGRDGQLFLGELVWEDDGHVLAPVVDGRESQVVRFGLDGSLEAASEPVTGPDYQMPSPIRFAAQP